MLRLQAEMQKIQIKFKKLPREIVLKFDLLRVQQILINLLSNALKFSKAYEYIVVRIKI